MTDRHDRSVLACLSDPRRAHLLRLSLAHPRSQGGDGADVDADVIQGDDINDAPRVPNRLQGFRADFCDAQCRPLSGIIATFNRSFHKRDVGVIKGIRRQVSSDETQ